MTRQQLSVSTGSYAMTRPIVFTWGRHTCCVCVDSVHSTIGMQLRPGSPWLTCWALMRRTSQSGLQTRDDWGPASSRKPPSHRSTPTQEAARLMSISIKSVSGKYLDPLCR